jgi:hypothetical protein
VWESTRKCWRLEVSLLADTLGRLVVFGRCGGDNVDEQSGGAVNWRIDERRLRSSLGARSPGGQHVFGGGLTPGLL